MTSKRRVTTVTTTVVRSSVRSQSTLDLPCSLRACCSLRDTSQYRLFRSKKWIKLRPYTVSIHNSHSVTRLLPAKTDPLRTSTLQSSRLSNAKISVYDSVLNGDCEPLEGVKSAVRDMKAIGRELERISKELTGTLSELDSR